MPNVKTKRQNVKYCITAAAPPSLLLLALFPILEGESAQKTVPSSTKISEKELTNKDTEGWGTGCIGSMSRSERCVSGMFKVDEAKKRDNQVEKDQIISALDVTHGLVKENA
ncbi:hypothetical protein FBU30_007569 [Linnemannia zychae]|nr:hypothetical protein FBU30_007569 [Linnemannia zychae]